MASASVLAVQRCSSQTASGLGDTKTAEQVFYEMEILPLQRRFETINAWLGQEVVRFRPRETAAV